MPPWAWQEGGRETCLPTGEVSSWVRFKPLQPLPASLSWWGSRVHLLALYALGMKLSLSIRPPPLLAAGSWGLGLGPSPKDNRLRAGRALEIASCNLHVTDGEWWVGAEGWCLPKASRPEEAGLRLSPRSPHTPRLRVGLELLHLL